MLAESAATSATRICHSTGSNAIHHRTGKPSAACPGARKVALDTIAGMGIITEPTEAAWQAACDRLGIRNGIKYKADSQETQPHPLHAH